LPSGSYSVTELPRTSSVRQAVGTGQTYGQVWDSLPEHERGHWLAEEGFKVYASKTEVRVTLDDLSAVIPLVDLKSRNRKPRQSAA
jgi:hypothetical protein